MTRKDYILIASALRDEYLFAEEALDTRIALNKTLCRESAPDSQRTYLQGQLTGVSQVAENLARMLREANHSFDSSHFLAVVRGEKDVNSKPERNLGIKTGTAEAEMFRHERNSQMGEAVLEHLKKAGR